MNRLILCAFLFVCLVCVIQASPLPQDAPQQGTGTNDFDSLADRAKKMFDDAKGALEKTDLNDALEKAKSYIGQAGENIRKEIEKIADKLRD